jgi:hypothetical protein
MRLYRETSGVVAVQTCMGPTLRFTVLIVYVPNCETGTFRTAIPDGDALAVAILKPLGFIATI